MPSPPASFMDSLPERERAALLGAGRRRIWDPGQFLFRRGETVDSAIVITSGWVKIHAAAGDGTEIVLGFAGPGELLGEVSVVRDAVRSATASPTDAVEGVVIARSAMRAFLHDHPGIALALLDLALTRLYVADARRLEYATSASLARVAGRLVELAERYGIEVGDGTSVDVPLPITQEDLASWSASSRESTARALRQLRQMRLIETSRKSIRVLDLPRLRSHAPVP
jgi:CRP-like cAMP-binding protein